MGFTAAQLESFRGAGVNDLIGPDLRLLFVGINPGLWSAATNSHFARRGNRFYPALARAGIVDHVIDASSGMSDDDTRLLTSLGIGITNIVAKATARADELTREELVDGAKALENKVIEFRPKVVAILGITAYRMAFGRKSATPGRQQYGLGAAELWVVPNPSGLNAHASLDALAAAYREVAHAAGLAVPQPGQMGRRRERDV